MGKIRMTFAWLKKASTDPLLHVFFAILLVKMWSLVRYSTINYEAIFSRELVYTTERRKSFRARNKQLCSRFQPFIKFPVSNSNYNKMSNNIDDNYV